MTNERFFITGAMGCLGAWVVRNLVQQNLPAIVFDRSDDKHRLKLSMSEEEIAGVDFLYGDITDTAVVTDAVRAAEATHIIHLAALQVPACKANPIMGAKVNVVGTANVFQAAKEAGIRQLVYASSVAAYGPKSDYPQRLVPHDALLNPHSLYGVYKQADEGAARVYWQDDGIASIGLRPYTIYGPGRDQGLTSSPTKAMLAAAAGDPYHIPFGGYNGFQFVDDVAKIFIQAAHTPFTGAGVYNIQGSVAHVSEVIAAIEAAKPAMKDRFTFDDVALPFPDGQEDGALRELLGTVPYTPLTEGVARTIVHFEDALQRGLVAL